MWGGVGRWIIGHGWEYEGVGRGEGGGVGRGEVKRGGSGVGKRGGLEFMMRSGWVGDGDEE